MKKREIYNRQTGCSVENTVQFISGKWKSVIMYHLLNNSTQRFGQLNAKIPSCTPRMLARQLNELEQDGLVEKHVYETVPMVTDYSATAFGQSLAPVITAMSDWGDKYNALAKAHAK